MMVVRNDDNTATPVGRKWYRSPSSANPFRLHGVSPARWPGPGCREPGLRVPLVPALRASIP